MKILILYTRLTGYWLACMRQDHKTTGNTYLVFRTAASKDAPFQLDSEQGITICDFRANKYEELQQSIDNFKPDCIYIAGWTNKQYLKVARFYKLEGVPIITGMDNQWLGSTKQYIATLFSKWLIRRYVSHIWVPGKLQYFYARKLGFKPKHILNGLYCADESLFDKVNQTQHQKQVLFVGRIVEHKGVKQLFRAVEDLIVSNQFNLKLHIVGNGPLEHLIPKHQNVQHTPFVAPEKLPELLRNAGTFILPSLYEAWGVVVHEAALSGLPIITTHECGAGTAFVIDGYNGYKYDALDVKSLKQILLETMNQREEDYFRMSKNSKQLASKITLADWSAHINSVKK